ncbi:MAG: hypothetical protein DSY58_09020 [Desulfobulbus sp.]|nr:MAG: hypothetical protein DSY58_09020 [Desulfobulbus sp.]
MTTITVKGMKCQHCAGSVQKGLEGLEGISNVQVDIATGTVNFDGSADTKHIREVIEQAGFTLVSP